MNGEMTLIWDQGGFSQGLLKNKDKYSNGIYDQFNLRYMMIKSYVSISHAKM